MTQLTLNPTTTKSLHATVLVDYNMAFATSDHQKILALMTSDAVWQMAGGDTMTGHDEIATALKSWGQYEARELQIENIISDGATRTAVNGLMTFDDSAVGFSDIYLFESDADDAKISRLTSYGVDVKLTNA